MRKNSLNVDALVGNEMLDKRPMLQEMIAEQLGERLTERLFGEIEKGEKIVCLKDTTIESDYQKNMTKFQRMVDIADLVRCKNCKYFIVSPDFSCCKLTEAIVGEDDFCSKGARCSQKE